MKFGYCVNMIAKDPFGIGYEHIPMLKRLGFDYVELPIAQIMDMDDAAFHSGPMAALETNNLPCMSCNNFFPASHRLTGSQADPEGALSYAAAALARAAALGAGRVVFGSSGARNAPLGFPLDQAHVQLVSLLRRLGDLAGRYNITLVIEHLNVAESNLVNCYREGVELAQQVQHPHVAVLADYYHMRLAQDTVQSIRSGGACLQHVHLARPLNRSLPLCGDGEDYAALFSAFRDVGYDNTISIEAYMPQQTESDLSASLAYLRGCVG